MTHHDHDDEPTVDPAIAARILSSTDLEEEETEDLSDDDRTAETQEVDIDKSN